MQTASLPNLPSGWLTDLFRTQRLKSRYFQQWSSQSRHASRQGGLRWQLFLEISIRECCSQRRLPSQMHRAISWLLPFQNRRPAPQIQALKRRMRKGQPKSFCIIRPGCPSHDPKRGYSLSPTRAAANGPASWQDACKAGHHRPSGPANLQPPHCWCG